MQKKSDNSKKSTGAYVVNLEKDRSKKPTGAYENFLQENCFYLLDLVRKAGAEILLYFKRDDLEVELKSDSSPVTLADKKANKILCEGLKKFNFPIISEEGYLASWQERKNYTGVWILDPLDGTRAFVKGEDEFTVNLAFVENGMALFGIIYAPVLDEICWGGFGTAFFQKGTIDKKNIQKLQAGKIREIPRIFVSRNSSNNSQTEKFLQKFEKYELVKASSSWKFCEMAKGNADIYPRFGTTCEWDIAAGDAIISALGGNVINAETGEKLKYNKENLENPFFVANIF